MRPRGRMPPRAIGVWMSASGHPFLEGLHGWPGTGLLASGTGSAPSQDRVSTPVAACALSRSRAMPHCPVTVAGTPRLSTRPPLATDPCLVLGHATLLEYIPAP